MRLIDLDQTIVVPVEDETRGTSYEMQMSVGEFFEKFLEGFEPEIVDAIPVAWLRERMQYPCMTCANPFDYVFCEWMNEPEAQDGKA